MAKLRQPGVLAAVIWVVCLTVVVLLITGALGTLAPMIIGLCILGLVIIMAVARRDTNAPDGPNGFGPFGGR